MQTRRTLWLLALLSPCTLAGHGLLNSFSDLQWLPAPGRTPDQWNYRLDWWQEKSALLVAGDNAARFTLCLDYMREKLAEAEAMVAKSDTEAARVAMQNYRAYLDQALALLGAAPKQPAARARLALTHALLEHQYMLSVDYPDLPVGPRTVLTALMEQLNKRYMAVRAQLPDGDAQALFFKEEEVRWSWEMARRAGEVPP